MFEIVRENLLKHFSAKKYFINDSIAIYMKVILKLILIFSFIPIFGFSQSKIVTGTINDGMGLPLPGVNVIVKNSIKIGVTTNFDGNFSITIPESNEKILVFSYVGFATQEVDVSNKSSINLIMLTDETQLEEVVIVGYGSVLKKDVTGSLSTVTVSDNIATQSNSIDQLLQGRAAGVQVIQNAAAPGSGISVKIRGTNSLRGNNEPLYVIDGIIISSAGEDVLPTAVGNSGQESQNGLNGINPRDIESIQVLKDASATAIYGSRGANGVILITTKKGKSGVNKITAFVNTSVRAVTKKYNVLGGNGYANYVNEINELNGDNPSYLIEGSNIFGIGDAGIVSDIPAQIYNWQDELYQLGFSSKYGVSSSGGSDNSNYYISAGFDDQEGIVSNSSFKSGDLRINLNQNLNENLKLEARVSGFFSSSDFAEGGDLIGASNQSFIRNVIAFRPVIAEEVEDLVEDLDLSNPFAWINDFSDVSKEQRYIGSIGLKYQLPLKGLSYEFRAGGNLRVKDRRRWFGLTTFNGFNANGQLNISTLKSASYQVNNFLRFNRTFNRKHRINSVLGVTYDVRNISSSIYAVEDFVTTQFTTEQPSLGNVIKRPLTFFKSDQQILSILGRFNYTFNNKYVLTASFRRDGVSKFAENNRYGFFPSFALAWNLNNEMFIQNLNLFEALKLRVGWGQIGNHGIGPYGTLSNYGVSNNLYGNSDGGTNVPIALLNVANPDLTWETTEQLNFGLDFETNNTTLSGSFDIYEKTTKDLLQNANIPTSSGFSNILVNQGQISNKGIELNLNITPISNNNFELNFGGNIAINKTEIQNLASQPIQDFYIDGIAEQRRFYFGSRISRGNIFKYPANVFIEGEETSLFYGFETDGIIQANNTNLPEIFEEDAVPGDVNIVDQNNDGVIDLTDRTIIGNPNPDFVYGMNLNLKFKGFSANLLFNGVYGNDIVNGNLLQLDNAEGISFNNILKRAYTNAWRPDNASNTHPRIGYTTNGQPALTDRVIEDGSYLRLSNITLSYDFRMKENSVFESINFYLAGQNLFTWTQYSGYNPEVSSFLYTGLINGVDWNGGPNARTLIMGITIGL